MLRDIIDYCLQDGVWLLVLWGVYPGRGSKPWLQRVEEETRNKVLMFQVDSYEPHGRQTVWSPWAKAAKGGTNRKGAKESRGEPAAGDSIPAAGRTDQEREPTPAEVSAVKAFHRKAEKQLPKDLTCESPAESIKPPAPKPFADFLTARMSQTITENI